MADFLISLSRGRTYRQNNALECFGCSLVSWQMAASDSGLSKALHASAIHVRLKGVFRAIEFFLKFQAPRPIIHTHTQKHTYKHPHNYPPRIYHRGTKQLITIINNYKFTTDTNTFTNLYITIYFYKRKANQKYSPPFPKCRILCQNKY